MSGAQEHIGTLTAALAQAAKLLAVRPALAEEQAREILKVAPAHPEAELVLAMARARQGDYAGAAGILEPLSKAQANAPVVQFELGMGRARTATMRGPSPRCAARSRSSPITSRLGARWATN